MHLLEYDVLDIALFEGLMFAKAVLFPAKISTSTFATTGTLLTAGRKIVDRQNA